MRPGGSFRARTSEIHFPYIVYLTDSTYGYVECKCPNWLLIFPHYKDVPLAREGGPNGKLASGRVHIRAARHARLIAEHGHGSNPPISFDPATNDLPPDRCCVHIGSRVLFTDSDRSSLAATSQYQMPAPQPGVLQLKRQLDLRAHHDHMEPDRIFADHEASIPSRRQYLFLGAPLQYNSYDLRG